MTNTAELRERLRNCTHNAHTLDICTEAATALEAAAAENERLLANLNRLTANPADHRYWEGRYRDAEAEIERLRSSGATDFRIAVERACDENLAEYKHRARAAEAERDALRKAIRSFERADTEMQRAENTAEQPRLSRAGDRYWLTKRALFRATVKP